MNEWKILEDKNISEFLESRVDVEVYSGEWKSTYWNKKDIVVAFLNGENRYRFRDQRSYPCLTPVTYIGDIIFHNGESVLYVSEGKLEVYRCSGHMTDARDMFEWCSVEYRDLKVGDTAYRANEMPFKLDNMQAVCKRVNKGYSYVENNLLKESNEEFKYWYKLVRKENLN
jgi:hypothetical protein